MKKFITLFAAVVFAAFILTSCEDTTLVKGELSERTVYLYLDYWNPAQNTPTIRFDSLKTSQAVKIDFSKPFGAELVGQNTVRIYFDNIRIVDDYGNYRIHSITPEEYKEEKWKPQSEFIVDYEDEITGMSVVLVLDASGSLGDDFDAVKSYAKQFVNSVHSNAPNAQFGVVYFNETIDTLALTDKIDSVRTFIDSRTNNGRTALYQAMLTGIDMLHRADTESKILLTFTDGNDSEDILYPDTVVTQLGKKDAADVKIESFTIGLEGEEILDRELLKDFSVRGVAVFPKDKDELEEFFDYFSNVVTTVYTLIYERNSAIITENDKRRIRFKINSVQNKID